MIDNSERPKGLDAALEWVVCNLSDEAMRRGGLAGNWLREMDREEREAEAAAVFQAMAMAMKQP